MRSFIALLALPFLVTAQNSTAFENDSKFISCSDTCLKSVTGGPAAMQQCQTDFGCYCTIDSGKLVKDVATCMMGSCPEIISKYASDLTAVCLAAQSSGVSSVVMSSSVSGSMSASVTGSTMPSPTGNETMTSSTYSSGAPTTTPATTKHKGNSTKVTSPLTTGTPSETSKSSSNKTTPTHTTSTGAAAVLEAAVQWPLAIIIGLAGVAIL